jgi:hypothetical protein
MLLLLLLLLLLWLRSCSRESVRARAREGSAGKDAAAGVVARHCSSVIATGSNEVTNACAGLRRCALLLLGASRALLLDAHLRLQLLCIAGSGSSSVALAALQRATTGQRTTSATAAAAVN